MDSAYRWAPGCGGIWKGRAKLLLSRRARERGLLEMSVVERLIVEHESGARDHNRQLWALLTLEEWHRQFVDGAQSLYRTPLWLNLARSAMCHARQRINPTGDLLL